MDDAVICPAQANDYARVRANNDVKRCIERRKAGWDIQQSKLPAAGTLSSVPATSALQQQASGGQALFFPLQIPANQLILKQSV